MGNIVIGYKNLCLESGVTFTESSQDASWPVENLAKAHPSQFWRITTLTGTPNVVISGLPAVSLGIVAPLYVTASPHRNAVRDSNDLTTARWTESDLTIAAASSILPTDAGEDIAMHVVTPGAGSVTPYFLTEQFLFPLAAPDTRRFTLSCYLRLSAAAGNIALQVTDMAGDSAEASFDQETGAVSSTSATGWSVIATSTELVGTNVQRISITGQTDTAATGVYGRVFLTDDSHLFTYTYGSETMSVGGVQLEFNQRDISGNATSGAGAFVNVGSAQGRASMWAPGLATGSALFNFPLNHDLTAWGSARGWVHSHYVPAVGEVQLGSYTVYFLDQYNAAGQLDVSLIYIGPAYQPTRNFTAGRPIGFDPVTGGRIFSWTLDFQTEADAYREYMAMALKVGVGSNESTTAAGGQQYRYGKTPILVIENPDDTTHGQERMVYGFVDSLRLTGLAWNTTKAANVHRVELTVSEVMK